jgi:hypothetical protein
MLSRLLPLAPLDVSSLWLLADVVAPEGVSADAPPGAELLADDVDILIKTYMNK